MGKEFGAARKERQKPVKSEKSETLCDTLSVADQLTHVTDTRDSATEPPCTAHRRKQQLPFNNNRKVESLEALNHWPTHTYTGTVAECLCVYCLPIGDALQRQGEGEQDSTNPARDVSKRWV